MRLEKHPRFNILISDDGSIIRNLESGFDYSIHTTSNGYCRVEFRHMKNGLRLVEKQLVHRLVAETYIKRSPGKNEVDHIDRNRQNNDVSNLRWTNHRENIQNSSVLKHGKYATVCRLCR